MATTPARARLRSRLRGWLLTESGRLWAATLFSVATSALLLTPVYNRSYTPWQWAWVASLTIWTLMSGLHALLTWLMFRMLEGEALADAVAADTRSRPRGTERPRNWLSASHTGSFAIQLALLALSGVLVLLLFGELRRLPILLGLGAALVVVCWLDVLVVYAVHYARADQAGHHIDFPGDEERAFSDYVYLSAAVQTTYGITDLVARTRWLRSSMTAHGLLAFAFNSVIIALIVSLALTPTS